MQTGRLSERSSNIFDNKNSKQTELEFRKIKRRKQYMGVSAQGLFITKKGARRTVYYLQRRNRKETTEEILKSAKSFTGRCLKRIRLSSFWLTPIRAKLRCKYCRCEFYGLDIESLRKELWRNSHLPKNNCISSCREQRARRIHIYTSEQNSPGQILMLKFILGQ
jgi:hypothetical protein